VNRESKPRNSKTEFRKNFVIVKCVTLEKGILGINDPIRKIPVKLWNSRKMEEEKNDKNQAAHVSISTSTSRRCRAIPCKFLCQGV
jgi:hypothetical protein